jgi:hypothetical protein
MVGCASYWTCMGVLLRVRQIVSFLILFFCSMKLNPTMAAAANCSNRMLEAPMKNLGPL